MDSRNHIMFGSNSDWTFKYLAGLTQTPEGRGWQELSLQPQVWNEQRGVSICQNLSSTEGSIVTPRGLLSGSWTCGGPEGGLCGKAAEKGNVHLSCAAAGGGTIKAIKFASFGTPAGECAFDGDDGGGFVATSCDDPASRAIVAAACAVGAGGCVVPTAGFARADACGDADLWLAVELECA